MYNSDKEALTHICAALAKEYKVAIELSESTEGAHTTHKSVVLGVKGLATYGLEYHVGLVLHEVAHIKHTPKSYPKLKGIEHQILNMLEDERIESLVAKEYSGGRYYLSELHAPALETLDEMLEGGMGYAKDQATADIIYLIEQREYEDTSDKEKEAAVKKQEQAVNQVKSTMLMRTLALALLQAKATFRHNKSTGNNELDSRAKEVKRLLIQARGATAKELPDIVNECLMVLKDILPKQQKEQASEVQQHSPLEVGGNGGFKATESTGRELQDDTFTKQDAIAQPQVANLKRKLIAKMRENQHQKYQGGKRKGLIDKKRLGRTAAHNYRIYKKREELKGKDYRVALLVDTSGSMFGIETRIQNAFYSAALMARTFRGMGYPTSITLYGAEAATVLHPTDRYVADDIQARAVRELDYVYNSGDNITHQGITECLKLLKEGRQDKQPLLVIITDGGLDEHDVEKSRKLLDKAKKEGVQTIVFYVESHTQRLLKDAHSEREIRNASELIPACVELAKQLV